MTRKISGRSGHPASPVLAVAITATALAAVGCTSLEAYSVRAAERSCEAVSVCTVYGSSGEHLSPCTYVGKMAVYPGDPRWPYSTPGVCDAVRDGKVVSTRDLDATPGSTVK